MDEPSSPEGNAITLRIKFKSASLDEFVARYGADVSAGGIFIRTKQPLAVGSTLHFDFTLGDGSPLMAGLGTVVWVREADASRVGSVPGMGLRFDQLTPEGQQIHQQILVIKSKRQERSPGITTSPGLAPLMAAPAARGSTPPPPTARASAPVSPPVPPITLAPPAEPAAPSAAMVDTESSGEFGGGKTEIADRPPSFFEALGIKMDSGGAAKPVSASAAPAELLDEAETDSRQLKAPQAGGLAAASLSDSLANKQSAPLVSPLGPGDASLPPASSDGGAVPLKVGKESSWLDEALLATADETAVPEEAPSEPTQETAVVPDVTVDDSSDQPPVSLATSDEAASASPLSGSPAEALGPRKSGKTLIVVGSLAACLAFAGVYLWMSKPWEKPEPRSEAPVATPAAAKEVVPAPTAAQPAAPAAVPTPAEPTKPAEPPKPAAVAAAAGPNEPVAEPAKPESASDPGKRSGAASKKGSPKPGSPSAPAPEPAPEAAPSPNPVAAEKGAAAVPSEELAYMLKIKSVPSGALVFVDGDPMGSTPVQRRILDIDKSHTIMVRKPGYDSYQRSISKADFRDQSGKTVTLNVSARLTKLKGSAETSAPAPAEQAEPAQEQPEKL